MNTIETQDVRRGQTMTYELVKKLVIQRRQ